MSHNTFQSHDEQKVGEYTPDDLPIDNLNISMTTNTPQPPINPFTSAMHRPMQSPPMPPSSHVHLNSDIQARLMAFQQKRTKLGSEANNSATALSPSLSGSTNSSSINNSGNCSRDELSRISPLEKPLPPLPESVPPDYVKRSLSTNDKYARAAAYGISENANDIIKSAASLSGSTSSPTLPTYSMPTRGNSVSARLPALTSPKNVPTQIDLKKKPSLSQRRGMKLNVGDLAIGNTAKSPSPRLLSPPITLSENKTEESKQGGEYIAQAPIASQLGTPGELSRRLSERKKKPHFKLNLDGTNSDIASLSRSSSLNRSNPTTSSSEGPTPESEKNNNNQGESQQLHGLFANYSKYVDIKSGQLNFAGKASLHSEGVDFSSGSSFRISIDELEYIGELGRGNYGSVSKVLHRPTGVLMAMKEVRLELDETKFTQILMELDILHKCNSPYIVDFYGAFFVEGAVYMCIEYMDGGSLDKIFGNNIGVKDECTLAYITESVVRGLKELKEKHNIIHRDVKPTNILVNSQGNVKLCDFGVSGNLVASLAKTNIGCQSYMAPERIRTLRPDDATYSVQSDIWSLGLTILELAVGHYPYPAETYGNIFSQLSAIVDGEPPSLDQEIYSSKARDFVKACLQKKPELRPSYAELVEHPWLQEYRGKDPHLDATVKNRLAEIEAENTQRNSNKVNSMKVANIPMQNIENVQSLLRNKVKAPALHRGGLQSINRSFLDHDKS